MGSNPKKHPNEIERLEALNQTNLLDSLPEKEYDQLVQLAAAICGTPIALISLVDKDRQWFKARIGVNISETPRDVAFCAHAIIGEGALVVENADEDNRFKDNPLVTGEAQVKFYAGVPIDDPERGLPIGTLCVIDHKAKKLSEAQLKALTSLKDQVENLLQMRQQIRKLSEKTHEIHVLSERQDYILEGAGLGSWDWWLESNTVYFDSRWCSMLGLRLEEIQQHLSTWETRVHPDDLADCYRDIKAYLAGKTEVYENIHRMKHANGQWVWILDRGRISERDENGKPIRFTGTHLDVTDLKQREQIFTEMEKLTKTGGWRIDFTSGNILWTDEVYDITGVESDEPIHLESALQLYDEMAKKEIKEALAHCAQGNPFDIHVQLGLIENEKKWVRVKGHPIADANGAFSHAIGIFQDVSEQFHKDELLDRARLDASHAAKMASLGELSAGVAHEINNPLAIAHGAVVSLQKQIQKPGEEIPQIKTLQTAITRMTKIVRGLRRFSRSQDRMERRPYYLNEIVQNSLIFVETKKRTLGAEILISSNDEPVLVEVNGPEIEQIIINLVQNALDACEGLSTPKVFIEYGAGSEEMAFIRVQDPGDGVPETLQTQIFNPFFTTKPVGKGTGLGLSISKGLAIDHGGDLRVAAERSNSCFELTLPLKQTGQKTIAVVA